MRNKIYWIIILSALAMTIIMAADEGDANKGNAGKCGYTVVEHTYPADVAEMERKCIVYSPREEEREKEMENVSATAGNGSAT
jgi:hypothetical protein